MLMISGWAFPPEAWEFVCKQCESIWNVHVISASSLLKNWTSNSIRSEIVRGIRTHLPENRPCFLGGWSLGGMLAFESAASLCEDLSGLLLIGTTPHFCQDEKQDWGMPKANLRAMIQGLRRNPRKTLEGFYTASAFPNAPNPHEVDAWTTAALNNSGGLESGLSYLRDTDLRDTDVRSDSCALHLPTVLIHGKDDAVIPYRASRTLGAHLRPSRIELISNVGHDLPLRRPDVMLQALCSLTDMGT